VAGAAVVVGGAAAHAREVDAMVESPEALAEIATIPIFCAHEHWGSLPTIGVDEAGFRTDNLAGLAGDGVGLFDLLFCPDMHGFLACGGFNTGAVLPQPGQSDIMAAAREAPEAVLAAVLPHLRNQQSTGTFTCVATGLRDLYDFDLSDLSPDNWSRIDRAIRTRYESIFALYRDAMRQAHLEGPVRPVGLSFLWEDANATLAREERAFTSPILRIDDLCQALPQPNVRVRSAIERTGIEPRDAETWRAFLAKAFELAEQAGNIGTKQLQAYSRDLSFASVADTDVDFAAETPAARRPFENWIVHECLKLCDDRGWPHQVHVGAANLPNTSPLPLAPLMRTYGNVNFVMLHCWPYLDEAAYLAKYHPNAFIDTCWLPVLSPSHMETALRTYLGYVPGHKVMCSQDSTSVEMAVGSASVTRALVAKVLADQIADRRISEEHALWLARRMLHDNAIEAHRLAT